MRKPGEVMGVEELLELESVKELRLAYSHCFDSKDLDGLVDLFTEDARPLITTSSRLVTSVCICKSPALPAAISWLPYPMDEKTSVEPAGADNE